MITAAVQGKNRVTDQQPDVEAQLIARIGNGDRHALADLYELYRLPLFHYLLGLTPDRGLAEELLQDTLVAVWRSAHSFQGRSSGRSWLLAVARRQAHNTLRRRRIATVESGELEELSSSEPEPEPALLASMDHAALAEVIDQLAPLQREVLGLIFVQELSYQESAMVLGVPTGTVKSRLNHARRALRSLLSAEEETPQ